MGRKRHAPRFPIAKAAELDGLRSKREAILAENESLRKELEEAKQENGLKTALQQEEEQAAAEIKALETSLETKRRKLRSLKRKVSLLFNFFFFVRPCAFFSMFLVTRPRSFG